MKALVLTAPSTLEFTDFETPAPGPGEVLLRIRACGICGSDIHGWDGSTGRRRPPLIMGHEAAGEIAALGAGVAGWKAGDAVTFDSTIYCGACAACRAGDVNLCERRRVVGVAPAEYRQHGAFAEFLALPARILHKLPPGVSFEKAAFVEPTAIAMHAVHRAGSARDTAVVVGAGMIGLLVIQALRVAGWPRIIAVDLDDERLALARRLGAAGTVNAGAANPLQSIRALTPGEAGADTAFEVVGFDPTVDLAIRSVRRKGTCVLVGNLKPSVEIPLQVVVTGEITLTGSCGSAGEYPAALAAIASGAIDVESLTSAVAPLAEGAAWFQRLSAPGSRLLKVVLRP